MNNPAIYSSMHFDIPITLENTIRWYNKNQGNDNRADMAIIDGEKVVAFCGITSIDHQVKKGESYYFVHPELKGKGIGTIALSLMLSYAFCNLKLNKVYLFINEDNIPSYRLAEKLGFKLEGRLREEYLTIGNEYKDRLYYGLLKQEFIK